MEEAFELISTGAWSIVPPLLALALALITKEVYSSLTIGVFVGMVIYQFTLNGVGVDQLVTAFTDVPNAMALQIADNGALLLFLALLGALTVVIATAGGSRAYAEWVSTHIKNARAAQVLTGLLGIIIFVDDYFNCLTVGAVMRPVTDRFHVSHEKLAWIIDSTAAPVCIIAPVSSWAVAVGGYLGDDGFTTFVQSIPYNFYALLTIFFVFFMLITNKNDYGPMRAAEAEAKTSEGAAAEGGKLLEKLSTMGLSDQAEADPDDHTNLESVVTEQADIEQSASAAIDEYKGLDISEKGKVYDLIVPILVLIFFSILGMMYTGGFFEGVDFATAVGENPVGGLCIGATVALCVAGAMFLPRGLTTLSGFVESVSEGVRSMVGAIMILVLAWSLGGCCRYMLGTGDFVSSFLNSLGAFFFLRFFFESSLLLFLFLTDKGKSLQLIRLLFLFLRLKTLENLHKKHAGHISRYGKAKQDYNGHCLKGYQQDNRRNQIDDYQQNGFGQVENAHQKRISYGILHCVFKSG